MSNTQTAEHKRLLKNAKKEMPLEEWGPYLSERQWGTVREDYSPDGKPWRYFPHEHARSRVYRWGEDGLGGISNVTQQLCFAPALWNGRDKILKERLFGLSNPQGNHGEDVKELYYYLDNIPTHYYMKYLYKYPQAAFPYEELERVNASLGKDKPEYELLDTGVFDEDRYFDVYIEYAKKNSRDIFIRLEVVNRGPDSADITILPCLWFYNYWQYEPDEPKPVIQWMDNTSVKASHHRLGMYYLYFSEADAVLFTENETNFERLFGQANVCEHVKDAFHDAIIEGRDYQALIDKKEGTKCAPVFRSAIASGNSYVVYLRLVADKQENAFPQNFEQVFIKRKKEADDFYRSFHEDRITEDQKNIQRQAFAGLLWNKQFYHYDVERWISTSDGITPNTEQRRHGRNCQWTHLKNQDILSMPDKWEYPWYAAWDMAFHCITMALVDPVFAKHQLILLMREWYMNPRGQLPAYEWNFSDVNPPVHAFAALQVYFAEERMFGEGDINFLKRVFQKLIINFTWWTNRKDANGNSIFEGGFLGLDNIGLFNRSMQMPDGTLLEQADGTSWMGMFALDMMNIALQIAIEDPAFEDTATKFYEHFVIISQALNGLGLWDDEDKFFYDVLAIDNANAVKLKVRSVVGLSPLFAVSIIEKEIRDRLPDFTKRMEWYQNYRRQNNLYLPSATHDNHDCMLLSLIDKERLSELLQRLFDESEFLAPGGIRALSKYYESHPYSINFSGKTYTIKYVPGNSDSDMFGGNSNWRGPVWMPVNYLLIGALRTFGEFYEDQLQIEFPTGSGNKMTLNDACNEIKKRLLSIFEKDKKNHRAVFGKYNWFYAKEENQELILFHEYFHGDNCSGLGASHQTGWTALVANLILELEDEEEI